MLRLRHDVTYRTRSEIDNVLAEIEAKDGSPAARSAERTTATRLPAAAAAGSTTATQPTAATVPKAVSGGATGGGSNKRLFIIGGAAVAVIAAIAIVVVLTTQGGKDEVGSESGQLEFSSDGSEFVSEFGEAGFLSDRRPGSRHDRR